MRIQKEDFIAFKAFCRNYFKKKREGKSTAVLQGLKAYDKKLYRTIEKTVGKKKIKGYIGYLLRSVGREGWLVYKEKTWQVKSKWGYCTYCFSELDDIYVIDIEHQQYCNSDCLDHHEAVSHYDSYADDYMFLFWEFENLKGRYQRYFNRPLRKNFETNLNLIMILRDLYNVLNDSNHWTILSNGGDDGPLASEMYRMLIILKEEAKQLEKLQEQCQKMLPQTNKRFAIEVSEEIMRKRKRPEVLREFIKTHRKYRDQENKNKWFAADALQRSNWYDALSIDELFIHQVSLVDEVKCPQCEDVVESQFSRRVPDGYYYCEECYDELNMEYDVEAAFI